MPRVKTFFQQPIHPSWIFYAAVCGIIIGIVASLSFAFNFFGHFLWVIVALSIFWFALRHASRFFVILAFCSGIIIGSFRVFPEINSKANFANLVGQTVILSGKITEDPIVSSGQVKLRLSALRLHLPRDAATPARPVIASPTTAPVAPADSADAAVPLAGTAYVSLATSHTALERSDEITIAGQVGAGFGTFVATFYRPEFRTLTRFETGDIFARLKTWFAGGVRDFVPLPTADLGLGYLVGMKSNLPENLTAALSAVGMTHVIVASGTHLGILVSAARKLFGKLSKFSGLLFSLLLVLGFVLVVGFTPSMTRAALVTSLGLAVGYVGRKFTPLRLISLVAALTLLFAPTNFWNLGWQLSFASFSGIMILAPLFQKLLYGGKKPPWLAGMLITSVATTIVCAPILIYNFGSLSFLSLVANLIILPTLPSAMLLVFLTGSLSFCAPLAQIPAYLATHLLDFHIAVVNFLSEQKMFILELPSANSRIYLLYLPILLFILYNIYHEHPLRIRYARFRRKTRREPHSPRRH